MRPELINGFVSTHGDVRMALETGWSHALMKRLDAGAIDLTFIMADLWPAHFEGIVLRRHGLAVTLDKDHPLAGASSVPPHALVDTPIMVFTRSLYPELWDVLYAPLLAVNAELVEVPDMAEGPPDRLSAPDRAAAFFDFGSDDPGTRHVVRIPVQGGRRRHVSAHAALEANVTGR